MQLSQYAIERQADDPLLLLVRANASPALAQLAAREDMVRTNDVLKCYLIEENDQKDLLTYDECIEQGNRLAGWLRGQGQRDIEFIPFRLRGTEEAYSRYCELRDCAIGVSVAAGSPCPTELTRQLCGLEGQLVRAEDSDGSRFFRIGLSGGWLPRHVELRRECDRTVPREHVYRRLTSFRFDRNYHCFCSIGEHVENPNPCSGRRCAS